MRAIITGMHRSGTSAIMGALGLCGLDIGKNFSKPTRWNPKGFYEDLDFRRINRQLLTTKQRSGEFDSPLRVRSNHDINANIRAFLKEWEGRGSVGWKDPFASLVINIWARYVRDLRVVVCERPQVEVAESLKATQGMDIMDGMKLAMAYLDTLYNHLYSKRQYRVRFIGYHDIMKDWRKHLPGLYEFLEIEGPGDEAEIDDFIDLNLWHQRQGDGQ